MENTGLNLKSILKGLDTPFGGIPVNNKRILNSIEAQDAAFQFALTSLSRIEQILTTQIFYEVRPSDFIDINVGDGSWNEELIRNTISYPGGTFFSGDVDNASESRLAATDIAIEQIRRPIQTWAKNIQYSIFDVYRAIASQNLDIIDQKLTSRIKTWQLGIQEIAFLGHPVKTGFPGLLTSSVVTSNLSLITSPISGLSDSDFQLFIEGLLAAYYANSNNTRLPNRFVIPASDYLGLGSAASATFPNITKLEYMTKVFSAMLAGYGRTGFEIKPLVYNEPAQMATRGLGVTRYALYNRDPETLMMNIPTDYTTTQFNTLDNFNFQNVGFGQYTGTTIFRPLEVLYFDF